MRRFMKSLILAAAAAMASAPSLALDIRSELPVAASKFLVVPQSTVHRAGAKAYAEAIAEARADGTIVRSGPERDRLVNAFQRIVAQAKTIAPESRAWDWRFVLVDSEEANAGCYPGGKIIFYTGLARATSATDAELAAVMGHEVAHALLEHGRADESSSLLHKIGIAVQSIDGATDMTAALEGLFKLSSLKFSRSQESAADLLGMELMARAGYDPRAAVTHWQKLTRLRGDTTTSYLSTHPAHGKRAALLHKHLPQALTIFNRR
jgi:predicted Zn-dependent protease